MPTRLAILGVIVFTLASIAVPSLMSGSPAEVPLSLFAVLCGIACYQCVLNGR